MFVTVTKVRGACAAHPGEGHVEQDPEGFGCGKGQGAEVVSTLE